MVKIITGIDFEHYPFALAFLRRLQFASANVHLLHVIESVLSDKSFPEFKLSHPYSIMAAEHARQGEAELTKAVALLDGAGYTLETELRKGEPARLIIETANSLQADLIAVGSAQKSAWGSLFFGSVTKALTAGAEQSILVAKRNPVSEQGLTAVLAVDHSAYCDECVEKLLSWKARGIHHVTILTALVPGQTPSIEGMDEWTSDFEQEIEKKNTALCLRFREAGIECKHLMIKDNPQAAIAKVMEESGADLLILGARGHGFWDRMRLGSVSHYQVVATSHNVLVIRV